MARNIGSPPARAYQTDFSVVARIDRLVEELNGDFGGIDILVNNARIYPRLPFVDSTEKYWERLVSVNAKSQYFMMQAVRSPHEVTWR